VKARRSLNPKRRFARELPDELGTRANAVRYGGNPEHKRSPGNFGLIPPAAPRADKTLCDGAGIFDH